MRPRKTALITDLDNTLFDWVEVWLNCFRPMLDKLIELSAIPEETLIPEIKAVHQRHGTSEYSFLIDELPSLQPILDGRPATQVFAAAICAYREQRRQWLKLYPTVAETLLEIKGRGTIVVGYTESMAFYSNYRIRRLGLDGVLDYVFCPKDHKLPTGLSAEDLRKYPAAHYELKGTTQDFTPEGSKKPDTAVLNAIISDLGLKKSECVFVGDSLMKDVAMALDCGVSDAWAKYGQAHKRPEYKLLQDVTHWTTEDVEREQKINEREHVEPSVVLDNSFSQLLDHFDFRDCHFRAPKPALTDERRREIIDIWKEVVDVQQHFNDISMRIRGMFVTILLAFFAAMGFLLDKEFTLDAWDLHVRYVTLVPLFGIVGTLLFYFIDRFWYHRLPLASVEHAGTIESQYTNEIPELSLGKSISTKSPYTPGSLVRLLACLVMVRDSRFWQTGKLHSDAKIELFYKSVIAVLIATMVVLGLAGGIYVGPKESPQAKNPLATTQKVE